MQSGSGSGSNIDGTAVAVDPITTMQDVMSQHQAQAVEARLTYPGQVDTCTFYQGPLRQNIWSCRDCGDQGVCYGCSISCHATHNLVELWARRDFTCDCPTIAIPSEPTKTLCTLNGRHRLVDPPNTGNRYTRNFRNEFCRCTRGLTYDPIEETEGMICCLACEDWFHESCLNLRNVDLLQAESEQAVKAAESSEPIKSEKSKAEPIEAGGEEEEEEEDDDEQDIRIPSSTYDALICAQCVKSNKQLRALAGTPGWMILVSPVESQTEGQQTTEGIKVLPDSWRILGYSSPELDTELGAEPEAKRVKLDVQACTKPVSNPAAQKLLDDGDASKGDIFVAFGARERLCRCKACQNLIDDLPFPLKDAELYEPPRAISPEEDPDDRASRLLETLPRSQALNAIQGFLPLKERLNALFKERSAGGLPVTKEDIDGVFEELKRKRNA